MIFNGESKSYIRVRRELFRPPSPPIEFDTIDYSTGGSRVVKKRFTGFTFTVPVKIISPDKRIEELKEELSDWLIHEEPKKLGFKDIPNRYYLAYYESMELDERPYSATGEINFYLPDGRRIGEEKTININSSNINHTITGQDKAPWTVETVFTGNTNEFELITNQGLYLLLGYEFIEGDRLTIKYEGREVWLNDRDLRHAIRLKTNYELLSPGNLRVRASHNCTLKYDERYF
ncbi:distal tail protein Dit [Oceanobacillus sp. FSL K6-3682]|uniref:distal tail protein Dit n=1 Tax=Oceanobacillus sp. FSL K6-3682 TaxID=2921503 RepID=UPI0030D77206